MLIPASKYFVVGLLGTITHFSILYISVEYFSFSPLVGSSTGFVWVVIQSYFLNRNWTFQSDRGHMSAIPRFVAVSTMGFFLNLLIMAVMLNVFKLPYMLAQATVVVVVPVSNFLLNKHWTFS